MSFRKESMGYAVRKNPNGLLSKFKLYLREVIEGGKRSDTYIPPTDYVSHGFATSLSYDEAKARCTQLNLQGELKRHAERKARIQGEMREKDKTLSAYVSDEEEFLAYAEREQRYATIASNRFRSHWRCAKEVLAELRLTPPDFFDSRRVVYRHFAKKQFAVGYCQKLIRCLNLYGTFYARKFKVYFEPIPYPTGYDRGDIEDAHHVKPGRRDAALPLTPALLLKCKDMPEAQYNWLYISLWTGLRPSEIDALHKPGGHRFDVQEGVTVLWVFQEKLKKLKRDDRWKAIPFVEPEQADLEKLIKSRNFERPLVKTITARTGAGYNCYSGRKGFEGLMRGRDHAFDFISHWLGHQSLDRTYASYTDRKVARFKKRAA